MASGDQCKFCGCDDEHACEGGCYWVLHNICSACFGKCSIGEKKDFIAVQEFGTYFDCVSPEKQKKILKQLEGGVY